MTTEEQSSGEAGCGRQFLLGIVPVLVGVGILVWQVFHYLQAGAWRPISLIDVMLWAGIARDWAIYPTNWLGVWKVLNHVPASVAAVLFGLIGSGWAKGLLDE